VAANAARVPSATVQQLKALADYEVGKDPIQYPGEEEPDFLENVLSDLRGFKKPGPT
jgi:hypothetical protein